MATLQSANPAESAGPIIRTWRARRRLSQLDLASEAEISQRHLSFVESGRAKPSRQMVLRIAERLELPLRETNRLLLAAGYAPHFQERPLGDPALAPALEAVERVLTAHEPYPAFAVDRYWTLIRANAPASMLLSVVEDPSLLRPPVNVLRLSLHPRGAAPSIVNLVEWRDHVLERVYRLNQAVADPALIALEQELRAYPAPLRKAPPDPARYSAIAVPLQLRVGGTVLSFISTITVFGTPLDVTLSEIAVESFFPADDQTGAFLRESR
jgi:transcriptional regulator with XRE-family HTH domain